eukprot:COSAG03_NODE_837_length_5670_cov_7.546222_4_plen_92_part_00
MVVLAGKEAIVPVSQFVGVRTRSDGVRVARPTAVESVPVDERPADLNDAEYYVKRVVNGQEIEVGCEVTALPSAEFDRLLDVVRAERAESV